MLSTLLLAACGGKKAEQKTAADLIADADHFQVDTIVATPDDTLVSTSVDAVLRHYPELYRAAEKAQQVYSKWALQEQQAKVCQTAMLDIRSILTELLSASQQHEASSLPTGEGRGGAVTLRFTVQNLFDRQYALVAHYPMPGRSFRMQLMFNF